MRKTILLIIVLALSDTLWAADPFSGTWVLNLSKSTIHPAFKVSKSQIVQITVDGSDFEIEEEVVTDSGERLTMHIKGKFDGKDYPITGNPYVDTIAYQRVDRNILKGTAKKDGKIILNDTSVLSPDGNSITSTLSITDATGKQSTAIAVFEKK